MSTCIPTDTTRRKRLANRRPSQTFNVECDRLYYAATVSPFADGRLAENFPSNHNNSGADVGAGDAAIENFQGRVSSPLCAALDIIAGGER